MENEEIKVEEVKEEVPAEEVKVEEIKEEPKTPKKGKGGLIAIIVIGIILLIAINVVVALILINNDKNKNNTTTTTTITTTEKTVFKVTFNSNGGDSIQDIEVKKDEKVTLPTPKKEGAEFLYWSDEEDVQYNETTTFDKDTNLTANWKDKTAKTMKITFDSKGGSKVSTTTYTCDNDGVTIKSFPKNPTKSGYSFRAWEDKNGKAILVGAKLTCEDLTLYAAYDQLPTCPDGYELGATDTICMKYTNPTKTCPDGTKYSEKADKCYTWASNPTSVTCKNDGTYIERDHADNLCGYDRNKSYDGNPTGCSAWGGQTIQNDGRCFKRVDLAVDSILDYTCPDGTKYNGASELGNTANNGCYTIKSYELTCEKGTLDKSKNKCLETTTPDFHNN